MSGKERLSRLKKHVVVEAWQPASVDCRFTKENATSEDARKATSIGKISLPFGR